MENIFYWRVKKFLLKKSKPTWCTNKRPANRSVLAVCGHRARPLNSQQVSVKSWGTRTTEPLYTLKSRVHKELCEKSDASLCIIRATCVVRMKNRRFPLFLPPPPFVVQYFFKIRGGGWLDARPKKRRGRERSMRKYVFACVRNIEGENFLFFTA